MISAIIVAKDNPPYLLKSIDSVKKIADEIIIGNLGIDDELLKKLRNNSLIKIIDIDKSIPYVELIREKMKTYAKNNYILFLDPDEMLPESLATALSSLYKQYDYISVPRKNIIFNKWIQYSRWWPDYQTRLFKKSNVVWQAKIHAQPILKGKGFKLEPDEKNAIIHHNYETISQYMEKMNRYAQSQAKELIANNQEPSLIKTIQESLSEFIGRFYANEGYKDGLHGLILAFLQMFYPLLVYMYMWEQKKFANIEPDFASLPYDFFKQGTVESSHWMDQKKIRSNSSSIFSKIKRTLIKLLL